MPSSPRTALLRAYAWFFGSLAYFGTAWGFLVSVQENPPRWAIAPVLAAPAMVLFAPVVLYFAFLLYYHLLRSWRDPWYNRDARESVPLCLAGVALLVVGLVLAPLVGGIPNFRLLPPILLFGGAFLMLFRGAKVIVWLAGSVRFAPLILAVVVALLILPLVLSAVHSADPEALALAALKYKTRLDPQRTEIRFHNKAADDEDLWWLARLPNLRVADLSGTRVTDAGLLQLVGLHELKSVVLADCRISDAGVANLRALKQLRELNLSRTDVTDGCLRDLAGFPNLASVDLSGTKVTAEGRRRLKGQRPALRVLPDADHS